MPPLKHHHHHHYHQPIAIISSIIVVIICCSSQWGLVESQGGGGQFYERPGVLTSEILRARGYLAEERHLTTADGYRLRLTRGTNPLINNGRSGLANKIPIVFIHGILESDNVFVINSFDAQPKDFTSLNLANTDLAELNELLADEPSAKSLPLLAMNLGHEVWIVARRGFLGSQQLASDPDGANADVDANRLANEGPQWSSIMSLSGLLGSGGMSGLSSSLSSFWNPFRVALAALFDYGTIVQQVPFSFDRKFWNYSFDQQAQYDFPQVIDYVLSQTGRPQVSVVTHSAGGAIELMSLSLYPQLASKINSSILWSQGFVLGNNDAFVPLLISQPFLETYIGSVPPSFTSTQIQAIAGLFCTTQLAQSTLCATVADTFLGPSCGQAPMRPEFINSLLYPSSSRELAQNLQNVRRGQMCRYDFGARGNLAAYGQFRSPPYNASAIRARSMSFYVGKTDTVVSADDVRATLPLLSVPFKFHLIDTAFNHNGYFYHNDNARLAIIPSMREIEQFEAGQS